MSANQGKKLNTYQEVTTLETGSNIIINQLVNGVLKVKQLTKAGFVAIINALITASRVEEITYANLVIKANAGLLEVGKEYKTNATADLIPIIIKAISSNSFSDEVILVNSGALAYYSFSSNTISSTIQYNEKGINLNKSIFLQETINDSTGVIYKGADRFLHNFTKTGTDGKNTFLGRNAGNFTATGASGTQGSYNVGIGEEVMFSQTTGKNNVAMGYQAMRENTTGGDNTAIGQYAMIDNTTGGYNTACGLESLFNQTTASYNTACGYQTMHLNITGENNAALGAIAMQNGTGYNFCVGVGVAALRNVSSDYNTSVGYASLGQITNKQYNSALGFNAGINTGVTLNDLTGCTFIGAETSSSANAITNSTAIGRGASVDKSNQMVFGNSNVNEYLFFGKLNVQNIPTSSAGLNSGDVWSDSGTLKIV